MINKINYKNKNRGFLAMTLVLLVSTVVLVITTGSFLRSIGQANEITDSENALKAWSTVNACGEYALAQIGNQWTYAGEEPLEVGGETCYIYSIEDGDNEAKLIKASSTVSLFTRKILIEVATNTPKVLVNSWEEVADF